MFLLLLDCLKAMQGLRKGSRASLSERYLLLRTCTLFRRPHKLSAKLLDAMRARAAAMKTKKTAIVKRSNLSAQYKPLAR